MHSVIIFIPVIRDKKVGYFFKDISPHDKFGILPTVKEISLEIVNISTSLMKYRISKEFMPHDLDSRYKNQSQAAQCPK